MYIRDECKITRGICETTYTCYGRIVRAVCETTRAGTKLHVLLLKLNVME